MFYGNRSCTRRVKPHFSLVFRGFFQYLYCREELPREISQDLYLIEPSGENLHITPPNNKPKEW